MTPPPGWEDILDPGETLLWQGRPDHGPAFRPQHPMQVVMGVFFVVFSTVWIKMAFWITGGFPDDAGGLVDIFPYFGALFLAVGLYMAGGFVLWDMLRLSRTTYTLTDRRAFIATDLPIQGRRLRSWPLDADTRLSLDDGDPGSVWFAWKEVSWRSNGSLHSVKTQQVPVGFERIAEARRVYRMMRDITRGDGTELPG